MEIGLGLSYTGDFAAQARQVAELESAGLDAVWVGEAYGFDAPSYLGYLAARTSTVRLGAGVLPVYSRTPALLAMTAAGLDSLSGGRFQLGLGASGPQVVEGWHGVPYDAPLARTREIVEICRKVWARDEPVIHSGPRYPLPLPPEQGTGLGKAMKIIPRLVRDRIPVWLAALGERSVQLAATVADGWLPAFLIPEKVQDTWGTALAAGLADRDPALGPLQIAAGVTLAIGDGPEVVAARQSARPALALYIGGMGARGNNFYAELISRFGWESEAREIQDLYLAGHKDQAAAAVPGSLLELTSLCGPAGYVAERIAAYREAGVTQLQVAPVPVGEQRTADLIEQVKTLSDN
ncbi:LLM class F420-dependent oxidoreductase [Kribbella sp. NPDC051586]|uniref:LLM class F420-dependent oxidoreductase n=1 Tax=Kribbella sp. NPDC051586 TaxID=3364118 RepID=UPI003796E605